MNTKSEYADKIIILPEVTHDKLNGLYNAADCFMSLGTYHDEDYGMSIAEAMCSGLPAILTSWAGYKSFKFDSSPENCELIPVRLADKMPEIDMDRVDDSFKNILKLTSTKEERSILAKEELSVENCKIRLQQVLNADVDLFSGRSKLMIRLTNENIKSNLQMFKKEKEVTYNDLYFEVYNAYTE